MSTTCKKKDDHCVMHPSMENTLLCLNCGWTQKIAMPISIPMFGAITKQFGKEHRNCPKTWQLPAPPKFDAQLTKEQRIQQWLTTGRRGVSSNTMLQVIERIRCVNGNTSHPWDPSDFNRCHLLVQAVPELREGFPLLAQHTKVWGRLIEHWDELTAMLLEEESTKQYGPLRDRIRELIAGKPTHQRGKMFDQQPA